jgi:molybdopterin molybdotransferase
MEIVVELTRAAIESLPGAVLRGSRAAGEAAGTGAWVEFRGMVRGEEEGAAIRGLEYEAYERMAVPLMRRIAEELGQVHPCQAVRIVHRLGVVPVGAAAIHVGVAAKHRGEAFAMLAGFMDRLKQDVPIWKCRAIAATSPAVAEAASPPTAPRPTAARLEEVVALVRPHCLPLEPERVPLAQALHRVLREPVLAPTDLPAFDRSAVDGFAVRTDDPGPVFRIVDQIQAGDWKPRQIGAGETVRIATGAALPGSGLQVIMKEDARVEGEQVRAIRREAASNIRARGDDARQGQVLVESACRLTPGSWSLLAALGQANPLVTRRVRVLHVLTGNEIIPPGQALGPGQVYDSNSILVRGFLAQFGVEPVQLRVAEDQAAAEAAVTPRLGEIDLLLISGGASVGEHDFTRPLLERFGFSIHLCKTNTRPGKPLLFATRDKLVAFGLPGNPLAHLVCLSLYVRTALESLAGLPEQPLFREAVLTAELSAGGHPRETLWPARIQFSGGRAEVTPLRWSSSGDVTSLAQANGLARVAAGTVVLPAGSALPVTSLSSPF